MADRTRTPAATTTTTPDAAAVPDMDLRALRERHRVMLEEAGVVTRQAAVGSWWIAYAAAMARGLNGQDALTALEEAHVEPPSTGQVLAFRRRQPTPQPAPVPRGTRTLAQVIGGAREGFHQRVLSAWWGAHQDAIVLAHAIDRAVLDLIDPDRQAPPAEIADALRRWLCGHPTAEGRRLEVAARDDGGFPLAFRLTWPPLPHTPPPNDPSLMTWLAAIRRRAEALMDTDDLAVPPSMTRPESALLVAAGETFEQFKVSLGVPDREARRRWSAAGLPAIQAEE